jgi:hypothetical protein
MENGSENRYAKIHRYPLIVGVMSEYKLISILRKLMRIILPAICLQLAGEAGTGKRKTRRIRRKTGVIG